MLRKLDVYLHEVKAGVLEQDANATLSFTYNEDYLASSSARIISVSMPLTETAYTNTTAKPFFSGLLPDESSRNRLANALGVSDTNAFGMLEIIGGDCAGALALYPHDSDMNKHNAVDEVLDEKQLDNLLKELSGNPLLGGRKDIRLSLAGAQDKLAVKVHDDKVMLVKNGEPTTHILKPAIQGLKGTSQNEAFCMMLARRVGLNAPHVQFSTTENTAYILVERFDRDSSDNNAIQRLHQEDFCQALSVPPELKYEDEGGPGVDASLKLIQGVANQPAADRLSFLHMQIFHYLVGNADAHAKNFALLHARDATAPCLAPVYDVVCTAVYPRLTKKMAMRIGNRNNPSTLHLKHWLDLVPDTKASQKLLTKEMKRLALDIVPQAQQLFDESTQLGIDHPVLKDLLKVIVKRADQLLREVA
jgi:serine/threonine-protein kinase HipA